MVPLIPLPRLWETWEPVKQIATGDFNGDGRDDVAAIVGDGALRGYHGNAQGLLDDGLSLERQVVAQCERPSQRRCERRRQVRPGGAVDRFAGAEALQGERQVGIC
ncbi:FG-GAP repeat domain-containing protein [Streptomyces crystallinus]|uniref:FG-GAP repeat domain-containing protein n=1 Tax=Streptomyces crystallinus TaxID=68191 RepID=UPI003CD0688A